MLIKTTLIQTLSLGYPKVDFAMGTVRNHSHQVTSSIMPLWSCHKFLSAVVGINNANIQILF